MFHDDIKHPVLSESDSRIGHYFLFKSAYMDTPPGVPGVSKELEGHKDQYLDVFLR